MLLVLLARATAERIHASNRPETHDQARRHRTSCDGSELHCGDEHGPPL